MAENLRELTPINNIDNWQTTPNLPIATASEQKLREIEAITGVPAIQAEFPSTPEIQSTEWYPVAEAKAKEAYIRNGQSVLIEETSFELHDLQGSEGQPYPGALVKYVLSSAEQLAMHAKEAIRLAKEREHQPRATARTVLGAWDGQKFIYREGLVHGTIVMPRGDYQFGFDPVFVPDGQKNLSTWDPEKGNRTFAEMTLEEVNVLSARGNAEQKLKKEPIEIQKNVYMTVEPDPLEEAFARPEQLQNPDAIAFAFSLDAVRGNSPDRNYHAPHYEPYHLDRHDHGVNRIVTHEGATDNGSITSGLDTQLDELGKPKRLLQEVDGSPIYLQFGPRQRTRALVARADEFMRYNTDAPTEQETEPGKRYEGYSTTDPIAYSLVRKMQSGEIQTVEKSNKPSAAVDELLHILKNQEPIFTESGEPDAEKEYSTALQTLAIATFGEVGYKRKVAEGIMSRKSNADYGLIFDPRNDGHPGSIFRMGYMPQGSFKDLLVTSALSFTDCGISRNSYMANSENQLALFTDVKNTLLSLHLPDDIYQLALSKVGIAVGVENPEQVEKDVAMFLDAGCSKIRFYSTCNDERRRTVPERIRQKFQDRVTLYYMPIVDEVHANELIQPNIAINEIGVGHGGGENCDSLGAGGAYTGLDLAYRLYRNPAFNNVSVGVEGGGSGVIALMPMVDFISKNKQAFGAVIETGGLFVLDKSGKPVQPYHGSASVFTQLYEASMFPETAERRISRAGFVRNVEGVSNYARFKRSEPSAVNKLQRLRMFGGLMLADHGANNINELRTQIADTGFNNIVAVSQMAAYTAAPHGSNGA